MEKIFGRLSHPEDINTFEKQNMHAIFWESFDIKKLSYMLLNQFNDPCCPKINQIDGPIYFDFLNCTPQSCIHYIPDFMKIQYYRAKDQMI